jgi:predicted nucleic acid-binding protein
MKKRLKMDYIFDASCAILLFEKCALRNQLLKFSKVNRLYVPTRVLEEYVKGEDMKTSDIADFEKVFSVINPALEEVLLPFFNFDDSSGEIWVISHALRNPECCCVIDEDFGRNIATLFETKLTGAIGIIKELKSQNLLSDDDLRQLRVKVRKSGFYLSKKLLKELDEICSSQQT